LKTGKFLLCDVLHNGEESDGTLQLAMDGYYHVNIERDREGKIAMITV
jgi:hypothetical protein